MAATGQGRDWTADELELIVADYFAMLGEELSGRAYSKTLHRKAFAAGLLQDHPHITVFPGAGIDVMPVVTGPPED